MNDQFTAQLADVNILVPHDHKKGKIIAQAIYTRQIVTVVGIKTAAARFLPVSHQGYSNETYVDKVDLLGKTFKDAGRRARVTLGDGYVELKALLPPPPRRALVLIDPSYEDKRDYARVPETLGDALRRFATGMYAVWYPLLSRVEARRLPERLRALAGDDWLDVALNVRKPHSGSFGMHGSGMFVVNPPWTLRAELEGCLPILRDALAQGEGAAYRLEGAAR